MYQSTDKSVGKKSSRQLTAYEQWVRSQRTNRENMSRPARWWRDANDYVQDRPLLKNRDWMTAAVVVLLAGVGVFFAVLTVAQMAK